MRGGLLRGANLAGIALLAATCAAAAQGRYGKVVEDVLAVWKSADVVCLGEAHGREYDSELRIALVRHPAFARTVRTIVIEWGNPVHQDLLDRFILDGAEMTREELAPIWRDASAAEAWESPVYEDFLRVVREVNRGLAAEKRVRVIAGDRKIDWSKITRAEQLVAVVHRGHAIGDIIAEQLLNGHAKVLAIYGAGHCAKVDGGIPAELEGRYDQRRVWSIRPLGSEAEVREARTHFRLGDDPEYFVTAGSRWGAMPATGPGVADGGFTMGEVADAVVYHGNVPDSVVPADLSVLRREYGAELERRRALLLEAFKLWQTGG